MPAKRSWNRCEPGEIGSPIEYFITLQKGPQADDGIRLRCVGKVVRRHDSNGGLEDERDIVAMAATLERYEFIRPDNG